jgi:very-short-patch-repair endonuclease/DNA polymerase III delta prime subunit
MEASLSSPRGLTFDYAEPRSRRPVAPLSQVSTEGDQESEPYIMLGDLRGDCPPLELQRRLGNLRRRDREWEEEQGLNVLYLALGFLEWVDEEGERAKAPLLLFPCDLNRVSPRDPFTLSQDDEDLTTNATLGVKLSEFGIELPEADSGIETAGEYLDVVRERIGHRPEWKVNEDVYLATFAYSKLAMWRDLETIKNNGTNHPIVLTLAGADPPAPRDNTPSPLPTLVPQDLTGARLDDVLDVRDQFAVLPADYSQLLAITAARSGHNLVIHGPPGTGKSQTIANIIATFLAEGKSVLFVSEKAAALDVVKRRLDEKQLGVFCLDLHSERGSKASVYQQLHQSVDDRRAVRRLDFDYAALAERRQQLNRVVRALHQVRQPLGRTVFQVQGRFASIRDVPDVPFDMRDIETLDQGRLAGILGIVDRVGLRRREFREHQTSHWCVLKSGTPSLELANQIRRDMQVFTASVERVQSVVPGLAEALGLALPDTLDEVARLEGVARHLAKAPGVPRTWLQDSVAKRLRIVAEREADLQRTRALLLEQLSNAFGSPIPNWDFAGLTEQLLVTPEEERSLGRLLGGQWTERLVQGRQATSTSLRQLSTTLVNMKSLEVEVTDFIGLKPTETWTNLERLLYIVQTLARVSPVPTEWTGLRRTEAVAAILERDRKVAQDLDEAETRLFSEYEPGVVDVVDHDMLVRYRTNHQSRLGRLIGSSYRSDRKAIQAFRRRPGKMSFPQALRVVEEIVEVQRRRAAWDDVAAELAPVLQRRYVGRNTNWDSVLREIREVEGLLEGWAGNLMHLTGLLTEEDGALRAREWAQKLEQASADVRSSIDTGLHPDLAQQVREGTITLSSLEDLVRDTAVTTGRVERAVDIPLANARQSTPDLGALRQLMSSGARLAALELEHSQARDALQADFGVRFKGFDTAWPDILACLRWVDELLEMMPPSRLSMELLAHAEQPQPPLVYVGIADKAADVLQQFRTPLEPLTEHYDLKVGPWDSWEQAKFDDMKWWSEELSRDADSASDWLLYRAAVSELDRSTGAPTTDNIRQQTDDSDLVPRIVERRVLGAWLDWIYQQEPVLASFNATEQEDLIVKFKELDEQLPNAARDEVRKRVFERYPDLYATAASASELGVLRGQLSRRRRQWPVRKLVGTIPRLIQTLKPCFLVSPLAVSQYLPLSPVASETLTFDVVIFDEASQVFPEDAVPAILRGKQSILAGDQKQLPPSNFFRRSLAEDEFDEDDDDADETEPNQLVGMESILDVAVGLVGRLFQEAHLNVHYRSQDESLIRFSNHHFYGDGLLTFPSPGIRDLWYGVHDVYVPDGRYDSGATRSNRKEAERVVELVFEHMRTRPVGESMGVVALSRPQANLIEQLVEERRILEPDVDERFNERPDEPFFVKNLENVQGDERDHMIISIGYGPTVESGDVPNRFGPLNIAGGERRLNVVVTRARQRVGVVHSLRASDIHSQQEGARLLRQYLEYAANPQQPFEGQVTVDSASEPESPFEAAVERALVEKGFRVARQVGVAGYRIDLAILSEDGSRYDLGIECDGWAYHSVPTARDRDWLRQKVLEGLGWKIHRVWSTAWVRNPEGALARIEGALAEARVQAQYASVGPMVIGGTREESPTPGEPEATADSPVVEVAPSARPDIHLEEYVQAELPPPPRWVELRDESSQNLIRLIIRVAEVEGPVHRGVVIDRIRQCYGSGPIRGDARDWAESAILSAQQGGSVQGDGTFIWLRDDQLGREPRRPVDGNIEHVPPIELKAIVLATAKALFGVPRHDLVIEVARRLGFSRTGGRITAVLDRIVQELLKESQLVESFGMVHAPSE